MYARFIRIVDRRIIFIFILDIFAINMFIDIDVFKVNPIEGGILHRFIIIIMDV